MKAVKLFGAILFVIVIVFFAVGFILPAEVTVTRSKVLDAPKEIVFSEVNNLKYWEDWSPWHRIDTNMGITYEGPMEGIGAKYIWTSTHGDVGNGRLEITESVPYSRIRTHMVFAGEYLSDIYYDFADAGEGTMCTLKMQSDMGYNIIGRWMGLFMDQMVGKDFELGLYNLEETAKRRQANLPQDKTPKLMALEPRNVVTMRRDCRSSEIASTLDQCYGEMIQYLEKEGLQPSSPPFSFFHSYSDTFTSLEAGLVVDRLPASTALIQARQIPATRAVMIRHFGPYEGTEKAHALLDDYIRKNDLEVTGAPWEVYVTDPATEPDQSKWLTEVYYPLASN